MFKKYLNNKSIKRWDRVTSESSFKPIEGRKIWSKQKWNKQKTASKMGQFNLTLWIIIFNMDVLKKSIKWPRLSEWIKKWDPLICHHEHRLPVSPSSSDYYYIQTSKYNAVCMKLIQCYNPMSPQLNFEKHKI